MAGPPRSRVLPVAVAVTLVLLIAPSFVGFGPFASGAIRPSETSGTSRTTSAGIGPAMLMAAPSAATGSGGLPVRSPVADRSLAANPSSDVIETPSPAIPPTHPTTFVVASDLSCPSSCGPSLNITAPAGPWALILMNYTGSAVPEVYDSSYHAVIGGTPVFFGTSPELYSWTVLDNLTEYSALFRQPTTFQFVFSDAVISGHFVLSVSLSFYPVPTGLAPPTEPNDIVPLWPLTNLNSALTPASSTATIPSDVQNATLELYAYGFSGGCAQASCLDEFWYSSDPAYRALSVKVDGTPIATVQPFEYVNTGGIDLFLWDPVTGAYTTNDVPYQVDVTAALGLLEGTHTFNVSVDGLGQGSHWVVGGSMLLYTNSSYSGSTIVSDPAPQVVYQNGTSGGTPTESVTRSYSYSSDLFRSDGTESVASWTNETFRASFPTGPAPNESGVVANARSTVQEAFHGPQGSSWKNATSSPSIAFSAAEDFKESSSNGGTYPIYGNVTYQMFWFDQNWNQSWTNAEYPDHGSPAMTAAYSNDNVTANGTYSGPEKLISAGAAQLLGISSFWSNTTKVYRSQEVQGIMAARYDHTIRSELTPADLTTNLAAVLQDEVQFTIASELLAPALSTDAGQTGSLTVRSLGFGAPYTFDWSGLPAGCVTSSSQATVTCRPTTVGTYNVSVVVVSALGPTAPPATETWIVYADPEPAVTLTPAEIDVGRSTNLSVAFVGGLGPFTCQWAANGFPIGPAAACPQRFNYTPSNPGTVNISVTLTDALGGFGSDGSILTVAAIAQVSLELVTPGSSAVPTISVGGSIDLAAKLSGGIAPFEYAWFANDASLGSGNASANLTFRPTSAGTETLTVEVTDADGVTVTSNGVEIDVTGSGSPGGGGGSGGISTGTYAAVGIGVIAVVIVLLAIVLILRRRRSPPKW